MTNLQTSNNKYIQDIFFSKDNISLINNSILDRKISGTEFLYNDVPAFNLL